MSAIADIKNRLLGAGTPFAAVEGAANFAGIENHSHGTPAAFILSPEDVSGDNERMTGNILQRNEGDIAIIIVLENLGDIAMGDAANDLDDIKAFVRKQLLGFEPAGSDEPMEHISGKLLKANGGTVWHEELFSLVTYLEQI